MAKYHISENGPARCKANVKNCPIDGEHYPNGKAAHEAYNKTLTEQHGEISTVKKSEVAAEESVAVPTPSNPSAIPSPPKPAPVPVPPKPAPVPSAPKPSAMPRPAKPRGVRTAKAGRVPGPYRVYHKDIGFPDDFPKDELEKLQVKLLWTKHAIEESENEKKKVGRTVPQLSEFRGEDWNAVEVKFNKSDGKINRVLFRSKRNYRGQNICLVAAPDPRKNGQWIVVTTWFNSTRDRHKTLDQSKYDLP